MVVVVGSEKDSGHISAPFRPWYIDIRYLYIQSRGHESGAVVTSVPGLLLSLGWTQGARNAPLWPIQIRSLGPVDPKVPFIQGVVLIQRGPWAGSLYLSRGVALRGICLGRSCVPGHNYPSRGLASGGLTSRGFHYRHGSHSGDKFQVRPHSNRPVGGVIMSHSR